MRSQWRAEMRAAAGTGTGVRKGAAAEPGRELSLPAQVSKLSLVREHAHRAAAAFGLDEDRCFEFAFAVNEAVTNAIRHGSPDDRGHIHLSFLAGDDHLTFAVRDYGNFTPPTGDRATSLERGRGFELMTRLMDAVQLCVTAGSTTVRLSKARP